MNRGLLVPKPSDWEQPTDYRAVTAAEYAEYADIPTLLWATTPNL
ncbi:MAG: hypothetical protein ACJ72L_02680 [Marmoricola sp.]